MNSEAAAVHQGQRETESRALRVYEWSVAAVPVVLLAIWAYFGGGIDSHLFLVMVPWLCLISAAELMPVLYLPHVTLTLSMPLLLAAGMTLGPAPAGILGYLGAWDVRFFRGQVPFEREVFNRGQIALSSIAGATTFHALGGSLDDWPTVVIPCFLAILADVSVNMTLVAVGIFLGPKTPFGQVVKGVVLDYPMLFLATYVGLVPVTLLLALVAEEYGVVGLIAGVVPILMARQVFMLLKRASLANRRALEQKAVIAHLNERIEIERRDERSRLAMDLHDGALAELYRVHLMGEVLRQDLLHGRLLDLEVDVPELKLATTSASDSLRSLIRGLRESSVGAQGLARTLHLLVDELASHSTAEFHVDISEIDATPSIQLVAYQVAREALQNAVRHANAGNIHLTLREDEWVRLVVEDDGTGFVLQEVDTKRHFGLDIMNYRVEGSGGLLLISSQPGIGTQVVARFPLIEGQAETFVRPGEETGSH